MENSLNYFQWLFAWLNPREWLWVTFLVVSTLAALTVGWEAKKQANLRKQEENRNYPTVWG